MRSVSTLRKALLSYLALVIKGLLDDALSCATCRRPNGSYAVVFLNGLQLGYRVKYKKELDLTSVNIHAVQRASIVPRMITDEAVFKALGRLLSKKRKVGAAASNKSITTVTAMRGHIMALPMLSGNVTVGSVEMTFAGAMEHLEDGSSASGWDPMVDGGASKELVAFSRPVFDIRVAARSLAMPIEEAAADMRHRVPAELMARVHSLDVQSRPPATPKGPKSLAVQGDFESASEDAERACSAHESGVLSGSSAFVGSSSASDLFARDGDGYMFPRMVNQQVR